MQYILRFNYAFVSVMANLLNLITFNLWNEFLWLTSKRYLSCSKSCEVHFLHVTGTAYRLMLTDVTQLFHTRPLMCHMRFA